VFLSIIKDQALDTHCCVTYCSYPT